MQWYYDIYGTIEEFSFDIASPPFLNGRRQLSTDEVNESRCVTKVRWIVEAVNARLKQLKFFSNTVQNSSIPSLEHYLSIACTIINRYREPIKTPSLDNAEISAKIQALRNQRNTFEKVILVRIVIHIVNVFSLSLSFFNAITLKNCRLTGINWII